MKEDKKDDILFQIDMQLYDEFNDKFCEMNEYLGDIYTYKDLDDLEKAEKDKEIKLLREAIKNLIARNKELEKENKLLEGARNWYFEHFTSQACTPEQLRKILTYEFIPKSKVEELREIDNIDLLQFKIKQLLQEGDK